MPPKKAGGKGGKDGPAKLAEKENLARAEAEVISLQRILELRSHEVSQKAKELANEMAGLDQRGAVEARRSERLWRERVDAFSQALDKQKEDTLDITADMLRQYKAMQEQLLKKISDLESENSRLRQCVDEKQSEINKLQSDAHSLKKACDDEVLSYQRRMEEMQLDFTQMLRDTLDKMHDRLACVPGLT